MGQRPNVFHPGSTERRHHQNGWREGQRVGSRERVTLTVRSPIPLAGIFRLTCSCSPQIIEAAVVGLPSEQWGQKVAAIVVLNPEVAAKTGRNGKPWGPVDMRRALKDRLASYKLPQEMKILDGPIPRNAMGKGEWF